MTAKKSLRRTTLEVLAKPGDHRLGRGINYLLPTIRDQAGDAVEPRQVMEVLWELLADRLAFIDYTQAAPENWSWVISDRGRRVAESGEYEPDDPEGYLQRLRTRIPDIDELVLAYAQEALRSYTASCYLASSVMLGVASERAFQLLGEAFVEWLPDPEGRAFRSVFDSPRQNYLTKFGEFRKRVEPRKPDLPAELRDNMSLSLDSVLDLLRVTRNEAGHPTGRLIDRDEAYVNLQMFARYLETMFRFRAFFEAVRK